MAADFVATPAPGDRQRNAVGPVVGVSLRAGGDLCPGGVRDMLAHARAAERFGFFDFDAPDHILLTGDETNYPAGTFRWDPDSLWPDPLVVLSAVAAVTSTIHLTTSILIAALRPAVAVAKATGTLDDLSGGRLRLGIGSGWLRPEFEAAGVPYVGRTRRMEESIAACRALWTGAPATFKSETVSFEGAYSNPRAVRAGGIPVLLAAPAIPAGAERVARLAEGWNPMDAQWEELGDGIVGVREAFERRGRDPESLLVRFPAREEIVRRAFEDDDPAILRDHLIELGQMGVTDVKVYMAGLVSGFEEVEPAMRWLAGAVGIIDREQDR
jgi:probable F420-dependent oxidoreductase